MTNSSHADEQARRWNGPAGEAWVDTQETLDRMFRPLEDLLMAAVTARTPVRVLDIGCGTGSTTIAAARLTPAHGGAIGIDISRPMLDAAQARAAREHARATFICGNAQVHPFDAASIDLLISRFGVMFFDDPVAAFTNLRRAAAAGARMRLITWRSAADNAFMTTAERAAAPLLPNLPPRKAEGPGQFAFADAAHVRRLLEAAGWGGIDLQPVDVSCALPEPELMRYLTRLGPVGLALPEVDADTRARVIDTVRAAFEPYIHRGEARFTAACWTVDAAAA